MADFLDELQEDIRHERYLNLWKAYGFYVIGVVVLVLVGTAAFIGWQHYQDRLRQGESQAYHQALAWLKAGETDKALKQFDHLEATSKGYGFLSRLQRLKLQSVAFVASPSKEKLDHIKQDIQHILRNDQDTRNGALKGLLDTHVGFLMVQGGFSDTSLQATLEQQTTPHNPWKGLGLEVLFLQALQRKEEAKASTLLSQIMGARDVPASIQKRIGVVAMGKGLAIPPIDGGKR